MSSTPVELLRRYLDAIRSRDVDAILLLLDPNAAIKAPMRPDNAPKTLMGRQSFEPAFRMVFERFKEFVWENIQVNAPDDPALAVARCSAKVMLINGRPYTNDYCIFVRIKGEHISESTEYFDPIRAAAIFAP